MNQPASADDERFDEIIADYLDAVSNGEHPDEAAILAAYPEFADELNKFFADHLRMGGLLGVGCDETVAPAGKTRGADDEPTIARLNFPTHRGVDPDKCIADYLLLEKIAEGGMGVVYKAKQLSLNRIVAFKMIRAGEFADSEEIRRFHIEAEAAAKLTHPGIVPIYQIGEDKGQHFFSMALVDGPSLADMIRQEPMKPRRAAEYVSQVARAVHYAHQQGIIHRDVKPANVLVDQNNQPQVTDFGLAKQITSDHELTMSGQILGTASYMSPEQASGHEVTPLADVYSLGALLYALLTRQPPFTGTNPVEILLDVLAKDPATPSSLNVSLSRDLETICMRCLEKDPNRRYLSAEALADDLDRFLDGTPILARPVGRIEKSIRWCQRRPAVATALFLSVMLMVVAVAYYVRPDVIRYSTDTSVSPSTRSLSLAELSREHYQDNQPLVNTNRDALLVLAGNAMLAYGQDEPKADGFPTAEHRFQEVATALEDAMALAPTDNELRSALADSLFQLAKFRFPAARSRKRWQYAHVAEELDPEDFRNIVVVADAEVAETTQWLNKSFELLLDLAADYPGDSRLMSRAAAVRAAMENLPGTFQIRMEHVIAAGKLSPTWDSIHGVVRFRFDRVAQFTSKADPSVIHKLEKIPLSNRDVKTQLQLAHEYCKADRRDDAISQYQIALADESISSSDFQQIFHDLAILAETHPDAVRLVLTKRWPSEAVDFYHAMLGLRLADSE